MVRKISILLLIFSFGLAQAQDIIKPPSSGSRIVVDLADVMDSYQESSIHKKLDQHYLKTSNEIVVVTIPTTGNLTAQQYALKLADEWGIGRKGNDNGVLVFAAIDDRNIRIEVGEGLEGAIPDAYAKRIIENTIVPQFRAGRFGQGFDEATTIIIGLAEGEYKFSPKEKSKGIPIWVIILIVIILIMLFRKGGGDGVTYDDRRTHRRAGRPPIWIGGGGGLGGGGGGFGGGGFGGGFGGGSFGGGGAGGSW